MKTFFLILSFLFLFSCISSEKEDYSSLIKTSSKKGTKNKRSVAYLKEMSQFKDSSFQFISKQMKEMIQNYERMKEQLEKIEGKLDRSLHQAFTEPAPYQKKIKKAENNNITLIKQNGEKVTLVLSSAEDYIKLMADILRDEYKIDEKEKEKLLFRIKNHIGQNKAEEQTAVLPFEIMGAEDKEKMDEDLQSPEEDLYLDEGDDFFKESEEILNEEIKGDDLDKTEEDSSALISAKKSFEEKSYETAISEFQKYRNENPEGVHYPEATFFIGKSFENLKMPIEAEVFFKEIVQSHPQSLWASRAKKFLKE